MTIDSFDNIHKATEATDSFVASERIGFTLPLASIIMPLYNAEKYVAEAIESVINQTYKNWELIIVNDGSLEQTYKVLQNLIGFEREKIKVYSQENKGASAARNLWIEKKVY